MSDSAFLGVFLGAKATGRWPTWHRPSQLSSLNLLSFLLGSPALSPLADATAYRTFLARDEVSGSKTQHHAGSGSEKFMSWLWTLQHLGMAWADGSVPWYMCKVSKLQLLKSAAFTLPASRANTPFFFCWILRSLKHFRFLRKKF